MTEEALRSISASRLLQGILMAVVLGTFAVEGLAAKQSKETALFKSMEEGTRRVFENEGFVDF